MTHELCSTCSTKRQILKDGIIKTSMVATRKNMNKKKHMDSIGGGEELSQL